MNTNPLLELSGLGQAIWLDYITRDLMTEGELQRLIDEDGLRGMTSNPTIFEKAIGSSEDYDEDIRKLDAEGKNPAAVFEALAVSDVQKACDIFRPTYDASNGLHGLVSLEVSPGQANNTAGTIEEVNRLWRSVDRPNVMIKIPGTMEGLP
ncbi:MAG: transaldolase family protein, partial [Gemmatimonadales bacterium]